MSFHMKLNKAEESFHSIQAPKTLNCPGAQHPRQTTSIESRRQPGNLNIPKIKNKPKCCLKQKPKQNH